MYRCVGKDRLRTQERSDDDFVDSVPAGTERSDAASDDIVVSETQSETAAT
jgi:hypothetical protein